MVEKLREYTAQAGRDPNSMGIEARITLRDQSPDTWRAQLEGWRELGATHVSVNTMGLGLQSPTDHIAMLRRFREILD
jgi:hypothetical protein